MIKRAKLGANPPDAVTSDDPSKLRALMIDRYGDLRSRLARRLGSADWADDALQDTYLKLDEDPRGGLIRNPMAYLFRAAFNTALNQRRTDSRKLSAAEVEALLDIPDETPDSLRILEARSDVVRLKHVLNGLPPRARDILLAARLEGATRSEIAERFGISVSLVEKELRWAHEYCVAIFEKGDRS